MSYINKALFGKPTLFSIVAIIGIVLGIPFGIYNLTLKGGQSLGGVLILGVVCILLVVLALDRALVSKFKPLHLTIFEILFSLICLTVLQSQDKEVVVDLENYREDYFVVLYNNGKLEDSEVSSKFIFNKELQIKQTAVVVPVELKSEYKVRVLSPKNWNSLEMRPQRLYGYHVEFYNSEKRMFSQTDINLIVKKEIDQAMKKNYR